MDMSRKGGCYVVYSKHLNTCDIFSVSFSHVPSLCNSLHFCFRLFFTVVVVVIVVANKFPSLHRNQPVIFRSFTGAWRTVIESVFIPIIFFLVIDFSLSIVHTSGTKVRTKIYCLS